MQQQKTYSAKYLRQRKFLVMLPLLVFPFFTLMIWSIGLIGPTKSHAQSPVLTGFNLNLPDAIPAKDSNWNKLKFYEQADKDSARYRTMQKNDPNFSLSLSKPSELRFTDTTYSMDEFRKGPKFSYDPYPAALQTNRNANEEKVYKKLAQLNEELNKTKQPIDTKKDVAINNSDLANSVGDENINRLQNMMQTMQHSDNSNDPEMQQIGGMLEKILDIQHPDRVRDKLMQASEKYKQQVFSAAGADQKLVVSLFQGKYPDSFNSNQQAARGNAFYSLDSSYSVSAEQQNTMNAVIPVTQTLVTGATIKLQLTGEVYINGILIPKDEYVYGIANLAGERLTININTIRFQNNILPVALSVYDMDGMDGIYVPCSLSRDVSKQSTEQAIQGLGIASLDPSLGAQAASAGIQAAKSLIGKKVKQIKVTVKAGYQVLLRDENKKNN